MSQHQQHFAPPNWQSLAVLLAALACYAGALVVVSGLDHASAWMTRKFQVGRK
jgi:hypothetical protein